MLTQCSLLVICAIVAAINGHPCGSITGGTIAAESTHRYQVSVRNKGNHICSGVIIDQRHILTSRYCVGSILIQDLSLIAGTNSLKEGGTIFTPIKIILHDDLRHDIALIRTTENIIFDNSIQSIIIANKDYLDDSTPVVISGWGSLIDGTLLTELLQELHIKIFDQEKCKKRYYVDDSKLCTIEKCGTHLCHIDIGSPLVTDGVLIGIKSLGYNCGLDKADVHVRIYYYREWIETNTKIPIEITTTSTTALPITEECF